MAFEKNPFEDELRKDSEQATEEALMEHEMSYKEKMELALSESTENGRFYVAEIAHVADGPYNASYTRIVEEHGTRPEDGVVDTDPIKNGEEEFATQDKTTYFGPFETEEQADFFKNQIGG